MNLNDVRQGIAAQLGLITGLRVFDYMPDSAQPPAAIVGFPESWTFDVAMNRGLDEIPALPVFVFVGKQSDRSSQTLLGEYVTASGSTSVKAAIEGDRTLGGACQDLRVTEATEFKLYTLGASEVLGCRFNVYVIG